ncbi:MAG: XRE family transcriptional regulator [Gaiellales bacterium]
MATTHPPPSTGLPALDAALGGLHWGDNVVWEAAQVSTLAPFVAASAKALEPYDAATWVAFGNGNADSRPGFRTLDATAGARLAEPRPLLGELRRLCAADRRHLVVFEPLEELEERWGSELTGRFFVQACPMLLGLGAVAHWQLTARKGRSQLRRRISDVTQCVLTVGDGTVRISKAEGRPPSVEGLVFKYRTEPEGVVLEEAPAAAVLGIGLRMLRRERRLSQREVAELARVSASAISQAERGERGLSLDTLLELTGRLGITLDELLHGSGGRGYRIVRRDDPQRDAVNRPVALFDDPREGVRVYVVRLTPGAGASPEFVHKGPEIVAVAQGLVQVLLDGGTPVLRQGEALFAGDSGVNGWRNLTDGPALAFWVLRDG